jgi:hypothetical protein
VLPYLNNRFLEVAKTLLKNLLSSLTCSQNSSCKLAKNQNSQTFE